LVAVMDAFQAVSGYVSKMVSTGDGATASNAAKMKILLLDNDTVSRATICGYLY
jgi:vacuolar protein sorting-associated protein 45